MTSRTAFEEFKLRFNRLDTNFSADMSSFKFCALFNKAQFMYIDKLLMQEEANKETQSNLQTLLVDVIVSGVNYQNIYEVNLPDDWYWIKRLEVQDTKCKNILNCLLVQESNIGRLLQDENWRPDVEWEETIFTLGADKARVYVDNFQVSKPRIIYYRTPVLIDIQSGVNNIYGNLSTNVDPEWIDAITQQIIDLAVIIAASDIGDAQLFQSKAQLLKK